MEIIVSVIAKRGSLIPLAPEGGKKLGQLFNKIAW
jgi:hypothetical protein